MKHTHKLTVQLFGSALLMLLTQITEAQVTGAQEIRPFTARYEARYYGVSGGTIELTLRKGAQPGEYVYASRAKPGFLAAFLISDAARETSTMSVDANGVRPLTFTADDGKKSTAQDSTYQFDWTQKKLVGHTGDVKLDQELPERMQDHLSVQVAIIWALQHNAALGEFTLVDGGKIKHYNYTLEGAATMSFKGRALDTTIVRSARSDRTGGRINRYWHAAELGNVPLRAERSSDGKVDLTIDLIDLQFTE
jgi:hypothetical protein